jgi:F0F1-type ATP synthase assembly protein I
VTNVGSSPKTGELEEHHTSIGLGIRKRAVSIRKIRRRSRIIRKELDSMRIILSIISGILILVGAVWILQGIDVLGGSVMTGQSQWAIYGGITAVLGIILLVFANRKKPTMPQK